MIERRELDDGRVLVAETENKVTSFRVESAGGTRTIPFDCDSYKRRHHIERLAKRLTRDEED